MTSMQTARETVYQRFEDIWGATTAYTFGNEQFSPPSDAFWVRLAVQHFTGNQESLGGAGNRKFSRAGQISIQLFSPLNSGMDTIDGYVHTLRAIFEGETLTGAIRCTDANAFEVGVSNGWFQVNIDIAFEYEEIK